MYHRNEVEKRMYKQRIKSLNFGIYIEKEFFVMSVPHEADEDYYTDVIREFNIYLHRDFLGFEDFDF